MKSKSISADADKIVNGLLVCKPLADEVYNKLRLLALQDEEDFRNKRFQERVIANNNLNELEVSIETLNNNQHKINNDRKIPEDI